MADIRIEKKSTPIWPWILGLLALLLVAFLVYQMFDDDTDMDDDDGVAIVEDGNMNNRNDKVAAGGVMAGDDNEVIVDMEAYNKAYATFYGYTAEMTGEMGLDHEFSHNALTYLANLVVVLANNKGLSRDVNARKKMAEVKSLADYITKDPYATDHADKIRQAAMLITDMLEDIEEEGYDSDMDEHLALLKKEASSINGETLTLNQKEDVRSFFRAARSTVKAMYDEDNS